MSKDEFAKLFEYMQEFRSEMENRFDGVDRDIRELRETLDGYAGRIDDIETENTARDLQFGRVVDWAKPVGKKVGIPLVDL